MAIREDESASSTAPPSLDESQQREAAVHAEAAQTVEAVDPVEDEDDDDPVTTPFDHPLFLPVLLLGLSCWFGWDGFLTSDPEMLEHSTFNRVGFAILVPFTLYYGYKGIKEWQAMREEERSEGEASSS